MKEQVRELVLSCGADLCGIAHADRFNDLSPGFRPADIYPDCKPVIAFATSLPQGLAKADSRFIYGHYFYSISCAEAEHVAFRATKQLEARFSCTAVPIPCNRAYEYWDEEKKEGKGLISLRHAAQRAGLGSLGKNTMLITKKYGNMVTLGAILTNLELPSDPLSEDICIPGCNKCIEACPVMAIDKDKGSVIQKLCRENAYGRSKRGFETVECNKCRIACPINVLSSRV